MNVKVLGTGCNKCNTLLSNVKKAVENSVIDIEVEYITDFTVIGSYGIMSTPALIINEKIVSMGKLLTVAEIEKLLKY